MHTWQQLVSLRSFVTFNIQKLVLYGLVEKTLKINASGKCVCVGLGQISIFASSIIVSLSVK